MGRYDKAALCGLLIYFGQKAYGSTTQMKERLQKILSQPDEEDIDAVAHSDSDGDQDSIADDDIVVSTFEPKPCIFCVCA